MASLVLEQVRLIVRASDDNERPRSEALSALVFPPA